MTPTPTEGRSSAEWTAVLDRIEAALAGSLEQTAEPGPTPPPAEVSGADALRALETRLDALQASLRRAETITAETDSRLATEAEALRAWGETVRRVREKLASWAAQAV
jgi:hypothetical protein